MRGLDGWAKWLHVPKVGEEDAEAREIVKPARSLDTWRLARSRLDGGHVRVCTAIVRHRTLAVSKERLPLLGG